MKLAIVIPAYNEEQAIAAIIERTLDACRHIIATSPVDAVEIIVVSDGSTDRTVEIARKYSDIRLIEFEGNQGYGAAIKRGFAESDAELLGFLDADGTCNPLFFADLCSGLVQSGSAIALGSRLGPGSEMPRVRRLGNRIYAAILSVLTNRVVHDCASGMRVIHRDALDRLYPLPDGLHFTPAMSARALLDEHLPVLELPMPYRERIGESKLHVLRDGWRFFQTILEMTLFWRPARVFMSGAIVCTLLMILLAAHPIEMWLAVRRLDESMIYRLLFCSFLGSMAVMCLSALAISESLHDFNRDPSRRDTLLRRGLDALFSCRGLGGVALLFVPAIVALIGPGAYTWIVERHVPAHWSRVVLAGLLAFTLCQLAVTKITIHVIHLHVSRLRFVQGRIPVRPLPRLTRLAPLVADLKPHPDPNQVVLT